MRDWSGCLVSSEIHRRKAEKELVLINAGLAPHIRDGIKAKAEVDLCNMLSDVIDALTWLRAQ